MSAQENQFIHYFANIPELYLYSGEEVSQKYTIEKFNMSRYQYNEKDGSVSIDRGDFSEINDVSQLASGSFLLSVIQYSNYTQTERGDIDWDISQDFYLLDPESNESTYLGNSNSETEKLWFDNGYAIRENDGNLEVWEMNYKVKD